MFQFNLFQMKYFCICCLFAVVQPVVAQSTNGFTQQGKASYYATKFHGRKTANGEIYRNDALTAAHPKLPFHTMVRVTNVSNGKSVVVRVNDRGPHTKARIVDVSHAAAKEIDMIRAGIATVRLEVISAKGEVNVTPARQSYEIIPAIRPAIRPVSQAVDQPRSLPFTAGRTYSLWGTERFPAGFGVQVASHADLQNAKDVCKQLLNAQQSEVYIRVARISGETVHRVVAGAFRLETEAHSYGKTLKQMGYDGFVKKYW